MAATPVSYDPWRAVETRTDVVLVWTPIAALMGGGFTVRRGDRAVIALDPALADGHRRVALTHELVHDERGGVHDGPGAPGGWGDVISREERAVDREVLRRLAPAATVREVVGRLLGGGCPVTARDLADELELPVHLAALALADLRASRS